VGIQLIATIPTRDANPNKKQGSYVSPIFSVYLKIATTRFAAKIITSAAPMASNADPSQHVILRKTSATHTSLFTSLA
jgi:hypothetical protein